MTRELIRCVLGSHVTQYQSQQSVSGVHEASKYGLSRSFLICRRTFLSCGLHSSESANGENSSKERKHILNFVSIFVCGGQRSGMRSE